jgi:hypothetical protein
MRVIPLGHTGGNISTSNKRTCWDTAWVVAWPCSLRFVTRTRSGLTEEITAGRRDEAREVLSQLQAFSRDRYVPPYAMALVHAGLGEPAAVFTWLQRAFDAHDVHLVYLPVDGKWDAYRADPRFDALLARCGFIVRGSPTDK